MNYLYAAIAVSWLFALSVPAFASGINTKDIAPDDTTPDNMETITVTASRTPTLVNNAGSAISLITRKQILQQNAMSLADLLRSVPGVSVSQQGGIGALAQVRVRGAEANQVLVLINGVEANDVSQGGGFDFSQVLASNIQRVEVVRGPQSALWGADALAGVINVITDPGENAAQGLQATAQTGSNSTAKEGISLNQGFSKGRVAVDLSHLHTAGTNISRTGNERDGYSNITANLNGHYNLSKAVRLSAMLRATNASTDFDAVSASTGLPVDAPWVTDIRQRYSRVSLDMQLSDRVQQIISLSRTTNTNINRTDDPVNGTTDSATNNLHLQTNIDLGDDTLSIMAEHELELFSQRGTVSVFGNPNQNRSSHTYSLAAELHHQGSLLDWSMSARHDDNSEFDNSNTWRVTSLVHVTESTGFYGSVGKGVKNPTFADRFGYYTNFAGNPDLRPEHSIGWELGLRQNVPQANLSLSTSYFQSTLEDEINGFVFDPVRGLYTAQNVPSASHRHGIELEANWAATDRATVRASYTWLDATQPGTSGRQEEEVRRPRNSASLHLNYAFARANINIGADYTGPAADDFFPPYPPYQERVSLASYTLVNVAAEYSISDTVSVNAKVDNLLNKRYEEVYGFREPGIAAYAGVTVRL